MKPCTLLLILIASPVFATGSPHTQPTPNAESSAEAKGGDASANSDSTSSAFSKASSGDSAASLSYTARRDTPPAYAPSLAPTAPCVMGASGGLSLAGVSVTGGGGKINEECMYLETARSFSQDGYLEQAQMVRCSTPISLLVFGTREACLAGKRVVDPLPEPVSVTVEASKDAVTHEELEQAFKRGIGK